MPQQPSSQVQQTDSGTASSAQVPRKLPTTTTTAATPVLLLLLLGSAAHAPAGMKVSLPCQENSRLSQETKRLQKELDEHLRQHTDLIL